MSPVELVYEDGTTETVERLLILHTRKRRGKKWTETVIVQPRNGGKTKWLRPEEIRTIVAPEEMDPQSRPPSGSPPRRSAG